MCPGKLSLRGQNLLVGLTLSPATEAGGRGAGAGKVTGAGAPSEVAALSRLPVQSGILVAEPYICTKCREV